jgi:Uma2 family endonuclease
MKWQEVIEHPSLQNLPFKIELNEWGNVILSPASNRHGFVQTALVLLLRNANSDGIILTECSVQTAKGVKVADVVWGSDEFFAQNELLTPYNSAPDLCIEILSPSNAKEEMVEKKELYIAKGAKEVWICYENGNITLFDVAGKIDQSRLFPYFSNPIKLRLLSKSRHKK